MTQPQWITDQIRRKVVPGGDEELQILVMSLLADRGGQVLEDILKAEVRLLYVQLASLDLLDIQNVVDNPQQGVASGLDFG